MSVPAPVGADTNDERDEGGEGRSPLEERCRIRHACVPPNHEIFTSQEMSAEKSRFASRIVLYRVHDASPQRVKHRAWEPLIPASFRGLRGGLPPLGSGPRESPNRLD